MPRSWARCKGGGPRRKRGPPPLGTGQVGSRSDRMLAQAQAKQRAAFLSLLRVHNQRFRDREREALMETAPYHACTRTLP